MSSSTKYSFLPWLRQGIATKITEHDKLGITPSGNMVKERPELEVNLKLNTNEIRKIVKIHGPGDIIGINKDAIIQTHPKANTTDFESNALAYIEFYEEDFPWRYTPVLQAADEEKRLRPWLSLIVVKEGEYEFVNNGNGLPILIIKSEFASKVFPNHKETWSWAHVHINSELEKLDRESNDPSKLLALENEVKEEIETDPDNAYSRLICPRRLEKSPSEDEGIKYHAFLIPAFETGRLAGLGEDPSDIYAQQSSWKLNGASGSDIRPYNYPVYYNWEFQTGPYGDFETLVSILKAQPSGDRFGKRDMNIEKPGFGLNDVANSHTLGLEGALIPPGFNRDKWPKGSGDVFFRNKLKDILNISQDIQDKADASKVKNPYYNESNNNVFYSENVVDDPIVTPPIYAKWQALVSRIPKTGGEPWVKDLNLDPRNRATAAIGSQVVMKGQEKYMEMAWQQVGEINEANRKIREAELAKMVNNTYYEKRLAKMDKDKLIMIASPTLKYILNPSDDKTFEYDFTNCQIPNAVKSAAFKKIIRPGKKNLKKLNEIGLTSDNPMAVQASLLPNFNKRNNSTDPDDDKALTTAKRKRIPDMAVTTEIITDTIDCFLDLQGTASNEDETLELDPETISTQKEYQTDFSDFVVSMGGMNIIQTNRPIEDLSNFSKSILGQINPMITMLNMVTTFINVDGKAIQEVKPIMTYPEFPEPMFLELQKISQDFIIPNISEIPNNTITVLKNNQMFIEAFMAGLNHEMSKELLWREFPTDQRGSYFRNFWDDKDCLSKNSDHDILAMHKWKGKLGEHNQRIINANGSEEEKKNFIVLVIRGDVLRKYPDTVVFAQKAKFNNPKDSPRSLSDGQDLNNIKTPIFQAELEPDVALFGFDITDAEAKGDNNNPGWFFVLQERPGQINFGLDDYVDPNPLNNEISIPQNDAASWNDLSWGHLVPANGNLDDLNHISCNYVRADVNNYEPDWGENSAEMAYILYQNPIIFARHAAEMIP